MQISMKPAGVLLVVLSLTGIPVSASAQSAATGARLTEDEAVRLALENNLGIQVARVAPQIQDLNVAQARAGWTPSLSTQFNNGSAETPANSFLSGAQGTSSTTDGNVTSTANVQQLLPWGANYSIGWNGTRSTTDSIFTNFSPQLRSSLALNYTQPLLRNLRIDNVRQQLQTSALNRDISDIALEGTLATTVRNVRNAYWELVYARASLEVQRQSLELAEESLRNTRARVEIGTMAPIDIVEAEAEVATREEAVIIAEAGIETAEDTLRALIFDPDAPDFWTREILTAEAPPCAPQAVDVEGAVGRAVGERTDLRRARTSLDVTNVNIRFLSNQTLPDVSASVNYNLVGLGGTQFVRGPSSGFTPGEIVGQNNRGFGSVLGDLFRNEYPTWTVGLNISYPLGTSQQEAGLARARLEYSQAQTQIRDDELQVTTEVRAVGRQVRTNQRRVETTRTARELAERRLEAEERKFEAGTSTSFFVFQAQRDLTQAQANELRAILDYNRSVVDFETVQEAPLAGQ
jgi:outer membrane protein TolC